MKRPTLSGIASCILKVGGKALQLKNYEMLLPFYDTKVPEVIILAGRQVGKTIAVAAKTVLRAATSAFLHSLTVLPSSTQRDTYVKQNIQPYLNYSELLKDRTDSTCSNTLSLISFNNGSLNHFSYISDDPDRVRGRTAKYIYWDEVQDHYIDSIPEVTQCSQSYMEAFLSYSGTAKTLDCTAEYLWQKSSQGVATIKCSRCNKENLNVIPDVYKMIQEEWLVCQKCKMKLSMEDIRNVYYTHAHEDRIKKFIGFRAPSIFSSKNFIKLPNGSYKWYRMYDFFKSYSQKKFANEILAINFSSGSNLCNLSSLQELCTERKLGEMLPGEFTATFMGVDWGGQSDMSLTAYCILGLNLHNKYEVIHAKKFLHNDRIAQFEEVIEAYKEYNCIAIGSDSGNAFYENLNLRNKLAFDDVYEYTYLWMHDLIRYNEQQARYYVSKTKALDLLLADLSSEKARILFPRREDMQTFFSDILAEKITFGKSGRKIYDRSPSAPDDFLHALNYAVMTAKLCLHETLLV
jgi:hypothetical protein